MKTRITPYWQAIQDILKYQIVTKICLGLILALLRALSMQAIYSTGRVAVSSGDFAFIFTSWQGWVLIVLALAALFFYVAFDLNAKILFSHKLLHGEKNAVWHSMLESFASIRRFLNLQGIWIILYIALVGPLVGFGMSISLTEGFYIPTFITSVIETTPLYNLAYTAALVFFTLFGIANMFCIHGVVLEHMDVRTARQTSKSIMKKHRWDYFKQNLLYLLRYGLIVALCWLLLLILPVGVLILLPFSDMVRRGLLLFFCLVTALATGFVGLLGTPFYMMKMTQLFETYLQEERITYPIREKKKHPVVVSGITLLLAGLIVLAVVLNQFFDVFFPPEVTTGIVAHRGGGNEAPENTVAGLEAAIAAGSLGSEIDIQRTKDGYYVINHDSTFARVAGDSRKPEEMTLEEVRQLSVEGEPVPTLEEMLDACRDRLILFVELKGSTADTQMCDDAVRILKEMGMGDQAVLISLKYDLIRYIETSYPEIQTGYLTYASYGDTAALPCDYLGLEEESATLSAINAIHQQGKKVLVWTVNEPQSQRHFLQGQADAIITDEMSQAREIIDELESRDDFTRIIDGLLN